MAWKQDELLYILTLLENRGNREVPEVLIPSYLRTQTINAMQYEEFAIAHGLVDASNLWAQGHYDAAKEAVRITRADDLAGNKVRVK